MRRMRITATVWLLLWTILAVWVCVTLALAWPYVQLLPQLVLLVAMPGLLFRAADLAWLRIRGAPVLRWKRLGLRVVTLVAGVLVAGALWSAMERISMDRFEGAFAPWVARLHGHVAAPCPPALHYEIDAALAAYLEGSNAPRAPATLHADGRRFVLALGGRSIDIDGSTVFYDSAGRSWRKVHNDVLQRTRELEKLTAGLTECKIPLRS